MGRQMGCFNPVLPSCQSQTAATWTGKAAPHPAPGLRLTPFSPGLKLQCPRKPQVSLLQPLVSRVSDQEAGPCAQSCPPHPSPPWEEAIGPRCAQRPTLLEKRVDATDTVSDHKLETRP